MERTEKDRQDLEIENIIQVRAELRVYCFTPLKFKRRFLNDTVVLFLQHARELEIRRREAEERERRRQKEVQMELERQLKEAEMVFPDDNIYFEFF